MFEYLRIEREDSVATAASNVAEAGQAFAERAAEIQARIRETAATQPWGQDTFGEAFLKEYQQVPEGYDKPFDAVIDEHLGKAGKEAQRIGDEIASAMVTYHATDVLGAKKLADAGEEA